MARCATPNATTSSFKFQVRRRHHVIISVRSCLACLATAARSSDKLSPPERDGSRRQTALATPGSLRSSAAACRRRGGGTQRGRSSEGEGRGRCRATRLRLTTAFSIAVQGTGAVRRCTAVEGALGACGTARLRATPLTSACPSLPELLQRERRGGPVQQDGEARGAGAGSVLLRRQLPHAHVRRGNEIQIRPSPLVARPRLGAAVEADGSRERALTLLLRQQRTPRTHKASCARSQFVSRPAVSTRPTKPTRRRRRGATARAARQLAVGASHVSKRPSSCAFLSDVRVRLRSSEHLLTY